MGLLDEVNDTWQAVMTRIYSQMDLQIRRYSTPLGKTTLAPHWTTIECTKSIFTAAVMDRWRSRCYRDGYNGGGYRDGVRDRDRNRTGGRDHNRDGDGGKHHGGAALVNHTCADQHRGHRRSRRYSLTKKPTGQRKLHLLVHESPTCDICDWQHPNPVLERCGGCVHLLTGSPPPIPLKPSRDWTASDELAYTAVPDELSNASTQYGYLQQCLSRSNRPPDLGLLRDPSDLEDFDN
ncbi:hypothetical protein CONLIGDRAFT_107599 [Coniochaeta ligniaria NRRL 30616]|uniref:Uncharacterized protein n=1 Tax=Coniochaeta ligniaria NRRL 30616 TaxID=1408157 RepID=A0A1J7ISW7_9PEZI|nr:hypothetical protein CONLIGDRAFT_107599 [Coniochaeta ligniaria NRRL 30616]